MSDLQCPYCDADIEINHDDGFGYQEGILHQYECGKCNKIFVFETSISFYYEPQKADCLNDKSHDYKPTHTCPKEYTQMQCSSCGETRYPTDEEMEQFSIPKKSTSC